MLIIKAQQNEAKIHRMEYIKAGGDQAVNGCAFMRHGKYKTGQGSSLWTDVEVFTSRYLLQ